ncbi:hypothetical protein RUM43_005109 [Polyplax serrata]|uniref:BIG2 domain-containing protein n=1 Tax=Polyplax serrata TaxID=468196 RepID=A0AAN8XMK1_POLSC
MAFHFSMFKIALCLFGVFISLSAGSKLNVPRVLLPLFHDFTTNFTLEVKDSGCYKWSTLRPNIISLKQLYVDPDLGCSSEVVISPKTKEFHRNSETVLAEDVHSGQILRCEVIVDVIHSLNLFTTTRELFLEESPEAFEVQAFDDQGNTFSTLIGVEFQWSFQTGNIGDGSGNGTSECQVVRHIPFHESPYETPASVANFDKTDLKGHILLLEGAQTGICTVTVRLPHYEYRHVPPVSVQLMVLTNLIINPPEVSILLGDEINYRLFQVQHGKVNEIMFPSKQYYLQSEKPKCVRVDPSTGMATGLSHCKTKVVLVDRNVISSIGNDVKPSTATISVTSAEQLSLVLLPSRKWAVTVGQYYEIVVEIYDAEGRKMHIGDRVEVKTFVDEEYFKVEKASPNGTYFMGVPIKQGQAKVGATLLGVIDSSGAMQKTDRLHAEAFMQIYNAIEVTPPAVFLPWDPVAKCKYEVPLSVTGGDGNFLWTSTNNTIAVVTQMGVVKTLEEGSVVISAAMAQNHHNKGTSEFFITKPVRIEILDYIMEAAVGSPIQLFIVLYGVINGVEMPFTLCDALTFDVGLTDDNFEYIPGNSSYRVGPSCASISFLGKSPGATRVSVNYKHLEATTVIAAHRKLSVYNPKSGPTILAVATSRNIAFIGGPRPWAIRPSEHSHFLTNVETKTEDWNEILEIHEKRDTSQSQHRDFYVYHVTCLKLGQVTLNLKVMNKVPASNNKPTEESVNVTVICGKPRYLLLIPVVKKANASKCPMHLNSERIISQNYRDIELEIIVNDVQGRKFDNISSLQMEWSLSHHSLAKLLDPAQLKSTTMTEEGVIFPLRFYQIIKPKGRTGVLDVKARIMGYNKQYADNLDVIFECPAFPEKNKKGRLETPDISVALNVILVNDTIVTPNVTEIYNHEDSVSTVKVAQGSGFYDFILSAENVVSLKYMEETRIVELHPLTIGRVTVTLVDLCLEATPAVIDVKVYSIGSIRLDMVEKVEKGKSITATVCLYDESRTKLNSVPNIDLIHLKPLAESNIIKVKPFQEKGLVPGEVKYLVSGVELGTTYLKFTAGCPGQEVYSRSSPIQVFPGLRVYPRNVTMLVGSTLQVHTFDGPADGFVEFYIEKSSLAKVDCDGVVEALKIGKTTLIARSLSTLRETGEKVIDSEDVVVINIVPLKGVSIQSPITRIIQGAVMPLWAVGSPEDLDSLRLGSTKYDLLFFWEVNNENCAQIKTIFHDMGIHVPESDQVTMRFKALKPGRVIITLTVEAPPQICGTVRKNIFTDTLIVEIYPSLALQKPTNLNFDSLLLSSNSETILRTNREGIGSGNIHYYVTPLPGPNEGTDDDSCVLTVSENGKVKTYDTFGRASVSFKISEDFGLKTWHTVAVDVKPVNYIMLNVDTKLKIKSSEHVHVLPSGLDIDFYVSFHDNFGNEFDSVQANVLLASNQKGCLHFGRGETNNSVVVSVINKGYSMLKIWDDKVPHKPTDYVKIHTGDIIFPVNRQVTVGDVICFRMPLTCGEDPVTAWSVSDSHMIQFHDEMAVGLVLNKLGTVHVSYQSKKKLVTSLEIVPIQKIEFLHTEVTLSTVLGTEYLIPVLLKSSADSIDKINNLVSYNGSCNVGSENFKVTTYPYTCSVRFNNPIPPLDIRHIYKVSPEFDVRTGYYSCKLTVVCNPSKKISSLTESVIIQANLLYDEVSAQPQVLNFLPGVFVQQKELKVSQSKPHDVLSMTGIKETLIEVKVLPEYKNLIIINQQEETSTTKSYSVEVDESWWTMEDPPQLSVMVWSKVTDQKIKIPIRCIGPQMASAVEQPSKWLQWTVGIIVLFVSSLVLYCNYIRPLRPAPQHAAESYFAMPFGTSSMLPQTPCMPCGPPQPPEENLYVRPFGESPVYGSPQRHRGNQRVTFS